MGDLPRTTRLSRRTLNHRGTISYTNTNSSHLTQANNGLSSAFFSSSLVRLVAVPMAILQSHWSLRWYKTIGTSSSSKMPKNADDTHVGYCVREVLVLSIHVYFTTAIYPFPRSCFAIDIPTLHPSTPHKTPHSQTSNVHASLETPGNMNKRSVRQLWSESASARLLRASIDSSLGPPKTKMRRRKLASLSGFSPAMVYVVVAVAF